MSLVMNYTTEHKTPIALIDSNIFIYAQCENDKEKRKKALALIKQGFSGKKVLAIANQNLSEYARIMTEKYNIDEHTTSRYIETLIMESKFIILDSWNMNELFFALDMQKKFNLHFWDAKLAATMISNRIGTIYTENEKDFNKIPGLKVINPFK